MSKNNNHRWPPVPGDFIVGDPSLPVAICTLGKKIEVDVPYTIIGTCKTENIGIERIIVNVVSNPNIRYFVLAGPEVPGHRTGSSLKCLIEYGIDPSSRKIVNAPGAIPYIENIPLDAVERFRQQIELIDMMNVSDANRIANSVRDLLSRKSKPFPADPLWIDFTHKATKSTHISVTGDVLLLPEYGTALNPLTSRIRKGNPTATVAVYPSRIIVDITTDEKGLILIGKEVK